jgi:hypothetical protein
LQYKVRWKGYSPAYDSWEPASQVHASDLIEEFQKIRPSRKNNNTTINCRSASEITSKMSLPQQHRAYSSQTEVEYPELNIKRTEDSEEGSPSRDKKRGQDPENIIIIPPFFHINACTMENNENIPPPLTIEEIRNIDLSNIDPTPTKIHDELNRVLGKAYQNPT